MFVDITRYGGLRVMRLAVAAIGYLDACDDGTSIHLLGGETIRVNEDPETIELRCLISLDPKAEAPVPAPPTAAKRSKKA